MICLTDLLENPINDGCDAQLVGLESVGYIFPYSNLVKGTVTDLVASFTGSGAVQVYQPFEMRYKPKSEGEKNEYGLMKYAKTIEVFTAKNSKLTQEQLMQLTNDDWVLVLKDKNAQYLVFGYERGLTLVTSSQELLSTTTHGGILLTFTEKYVNTPMLFTTQSVYELLNYDLTDYAMSESVPIIQNGLLRFNVDADKTGLVLTPDGVLHSTTSGELNMTYTGVAGYLKFIYPLTSEICAYFAESTARHALSTKTYAGTTYYVNAAKSDDSGNGLTAGTAKKTITAAYALASDGDIIQLLDGTYDLSEESGGYLDLNRHGIGVHIKGNALDKTAVGLDNSTSGAYVVRLRDCGDIKFSNLTLSTSLNVNLVNADYNSSYLNEKAIFHNCKFSHTGTGAISVFSRASSSVTDTFVSLNEFYNCEFDNSLFGGSAVFDAYLNSPTSIFHIEGCTFDAANQKQINISTGKPKCYVYDNIIIMNGNIKAVQFGLDTANPAYNFSAIDFRSNTITYTAGKAEHGILIGRGVVEGTFYANEITIPTKADSLALGIVVKSTPATVGNVLIYGNYVDAPRPMYIKGGSKNDIRYNYLVCNTTGYAGLEYVNYLAGGTDVLSTYNVVKYNTVDGGGFGYNIIIYDGGCSQEENVTIQTNTFSNNRYSDENKYLLDVSTDYEWADRDDFWTSNETDSVIIG